VDVDIRFGPFTCVAGANGVGKSNLFDAIHFLSSLADRPLIEAALAIRDEGGRTADIRSLLHCVGGTYNKEMSFEAEMIVPQHGIDDLGQEAQASITFLKYALTLAYRSDDVGRTYGILHVTKEELSYITHGDAYRNIRFSHSAEWRRSAVVGVRRSPFFISTEGDGDNLTIRLHQDGNSGRPLSRSAANLPRTVLSVTNAAESPTALLARREMQSWRLLQLEPSSLRKPDEFRSPSKLGMDGAHLPATLYRLARNNGKEHGDESGGSPGELDTRVYERVAGRLSELITDVRSVSVDRDERRELLTLQVSGPDHTAHPARALSDGTLRFLALAVLELDPEAQGVLCLEEPENGIHPERIPAMLRLLQDFVTDVHIPLGPDNPLRQVIINTHSPSVVMQVPDDSLLVAETEQAVRSGALYNQVCFGYLPGTWRDRGEGASPVPKGRLLVYLNPVADLDSGSIHNNGIARHRGPSRRVIDRPDFQMVLPNLIGDK